MEIGAGDTRTLLSSVVLFLHQEVELIETIGRGAVLLLIVAEGLQEANHCNATFMLERFHVFEELKN